MRHEGMPTPVAICNHQFMHCLLRGLPFCTVYHPFMRAWLGTWDLNFLQHSDHWKIQSSLYSLRKPNLRQGPTLVRIICKYSEFYVNRTHNRPYQRYSLIYQTTSGVSQLLSSGLTTSLPLNGALCWLCVIVQVLMKSCCGHLASMIPGMKPPAASIFHANNTIRRDEKTCKKPYTHSMWHRSERCSLIWWPPDIRLLNPIMAGTMNSISLLQHVMTGFKENLFCAYSI